MIDRWEPRPAAPSGDSRLPLRRHGVLRQITPPARGSSECGYGQSVNVLQDHFLTLRKFLEVDRKLTPRY